MQLNIKKLSPLATQMVEAYKEAHDIPTNSKAVSAMLEDHKKFNNLNMQLNTLGEEYKELRDRYRSLCKNLKQVRAHLDHLDD